MSLELLRKISQARLPCNIDKPEDIRELREMRDAGMVMAMFLRRPDTRSDTLAREEAHVLAISAAGREALRRNNRAS